MIVTEHMRVLLLYSWSTLKCGLQTSDVSPKILNKQVEVDLSEEVCVLASDLRLLSSSSSSLLYSSARKPAAR
jgi:hypothetical protein